MRHHYGWSIQDLEDLIPFEMIVHIGHTKAYNQKLAEARQQQGG